ncbi:MAG: ribose-phosphate diphosphokinase [Candidatus Thermoplasmatota archaeon]|nr:ribose-phosphate diphosphokinase [Candidatus Thermoplasmatota archaeon]
MRILKGTSNPALAENLSKVLGASMVDRELARFPDGELYLRIKESVEGQDIVLVQSTYPDDNSVQFLLLSSTLKDLGARSVIGVIPYYGYARQDRVFKDGESFSARTMARHLRMDLDHVICVNLHKEATLSAFDPLKSAANVSVMGVIGSFVKNKGVEFVLSPDKGAIGYARETAGAAGCGFDHLEKTRIDGRSVMMTPKKLDVRGKAVCIVDDIIATGGTILKAQELLRGQGAREVFACCAHGLFTGGGRDRLEPVLDGLFSSDTIENPTSSFSAAVPVATRIREILE